MIKEGFLYEIILMDVCFEGCFLMDVFDGGCNWFDFMCLEGDDFFVLFKEDFEVGSECVCWIGEVDLGVLGCEEVFFCGVVN